MEFSLSYIQLSQDDPLFILRVHWLQFSKLSVGRFCLKQTVHAMMECHNLWHLICYGSLLFAKESQPQNAEFCG